MNIDFTRMITPEACAATDLAARREAMVCSRLQGRLVLGPARDHRQRHRMAPHLADHGGAGMGAWHHRRANGHVVRGSNAGGGVRGDGHDVRDHNRRG